MVGPQLTELLFDLQVQICEFLQPPQILALRQTSKTFQQVTSQRIVWIHALNRICHDNFLFLPTFSIPDMSDAELERAATVPFRWIALSSPRARNGKVPFLWIDLTFSGAENDDGDETLQLRMIRTIENPIGSEDRSKGLDKVYLVPGGRYLVISSWRFLGVWDLGNASDSTNGRLIGTWKAEGIIAASIDFVVHPTPDGLGIRIVATSSLAINTYTFYVFEIYPQQETPKLSKLAELPINNYRAESQRFTYSLSGSRVVIYERMKGTFIVWDFILNTVASWSITVTQHGGRALDQVILQVTETVVVIHDTRDSLSIFDIPPLESRKTPLDINEDLPIVTSVLSYVDAEAWFQRPDSWYSGDLSSLPLCVNISEQKKRKPCRFDITSDLSTTHLVPIAKAKSQRPSENRNHVGDYGYRICDDKFVNIYYRSTWFSTAMLEVDVCGGFGPSSNDQAHNLSQIRDMRIMFPSSMELSHSLTHSSFCPVSARFVFIVESDITIADFL